MVLSEIMSSTALHLSAVVHVLTCEILFCLNRKEDLGQAELVLN